VSGPGRPDDPGKDFETELRDLVARFDPVPERVKSRARRAAHAHAPEYSELLSLIYDSGLDPDLITLQRDNPVRLLSFSGGGIRLDLRLNADDAGWQLSGWTTPAPPIKVTLRTERATTTLEVQTDGTFRADRPPSHVSIVVEVILNRVLCRFHSSWFRF
jgi:hypothetical protein